MLASQHKRYMCYVHIQNNRADYNYTQWKLLYVSLQTT
jgi:hypothetical protein